MKEMNMIRVFNRLVNLLTTISTEDKENATKKDIGYIIHSSIISVHKHIILVLYKLKVDITTQRVSALLL